LAGAKILVPVHVLTSRFQSENGRFAEMSVRCENIFMKKPYVTAVTMLAAGMMMLHGNALAQEAPASAPSQTGPAKTQQTSAAKTPHSPAAKATVAKSPSAMALKTPEDKLSYAIGLNVGRSLQKDSITVDQNIVIQGFKDALAGSKTLMTDDEAKSAIMALQTELRKKQDEIAKQTGEVNKKEGEEFLAANKAKEGVVTLPSGLQYKILKAGTGPKPTASDQVVCNYKGTLINGTEFDSSYKRGQPATFPVGQVIKGWTEALQMMPVGSTWQLFIPPDMAYGPRGPSPEIGPNATLIFEVELLSIKAQ
jgi:FKBP-type peptidyl-prolyl cis-trans isomerase FklB